MERPLPGSTTRFPGHCADRKYDTRDPVPRTASAAGSIDLPSPHPPQLPQHPQHPNTKAPTLTPSHTYTPPPTSESIGQDDLVEGEVVGVEFAEERKRLLVWHLAPLALPNLAPAEIKHTTQAQGGPRLCAGAVDAGAQRRR
eukprot:1595503-Rhodomonas_salina.6